MKQNLNLGIVLKLLTSDRKECADDAIRAAALKILIGMVCPSWSVDIVEEDGVIRMIVELGPTV